MDAEISKSAREEVLAALHARYVSSTKHEKARILDEVVALMGCHRKHAIRLLRRQSVARLSNGNRIGKRVYDEAVREALVEAWEASDRICGKRLAPILPVLVESLARHGRLKLEASVRQRLLQASPATIDRLLASFRKKAHSQRKRRRSAPKPSRQIPTRTFGDWQSARPGCLEIDFVVHCGGDLSGSFVHSLVATDVYSGWTEAVALLAREQSLVVEGLEVIRNRLPVPMLGINSDNDSAFINETLLSYCATHGLEFTRSRAYRKNDQAWIEQKNGAVIRRFVGHARYTGMVAGRSLAYLYETLRLFVNFFQPSFKLREKRRDGCHVRKKYFEPATPCDRLLDHSSVTAEQKAKLLRERAEHDPVVLLHRIREAQSALAALAAPESSAGPQRQTLEEFLSKLPRLWQSGDARPTHRAAPSKPRDWRTHPDDFEGVWSDVLAWLQAAPDATAKSLFQRLQREHPGRFADGQLRTLQRRVREWRHVMARQLVYSCLPEPKTSVNAESAEAKGNDIAVS